MAVNLEKWKEKLENYIEETETVFKEWKKEMKKILFESREKEISEAFDYYCKEIIEKRILETLKPSKKIAQCILDLESEERDKWLEADKTISWAFYPKKTVSDNIEKRFRKDKDAKFPKSMKEVSNYLETSVKLLFLYFSFGEDKWKVKIIRKKEKFQELFDEYKVEPLSISETEGEKKSYQDLTERNMRVEYNYLLQRKIGELFFLPFPHEAEGWEKEMLLTMEKWDKKLKWLARNKNTLFINEKYKINFYDGFQFNFLSVCNIILYNYAYQKNNEWIKNRAKKAVDLIFSSIDKEETINQHLEAENKLKKLRADKEELLVKSITFFWQNCFFEKFKHQGVLTLNDESFGDWRNNSIGKLPVCCYCLKKEEEDYVNEDELAVKGYRKIVVFPALFAVDNNGQRITIDEVFTLFLKSRVPNSKSFIYWVDKYIEELCLTDQDKEKKEQLKEINKSSEWLVFHASSWQRNFSFVSLTDENSQYLGPILVYEGEKEKSGKYFLSFKKYKDLEKTKVIDVKETIDNLDNVSEKQKHSLDSFFYLFSQKKRNYSEKITKEAIEISEYIEFLNHYITDYEEKIVNHKVVTDNVMEEVCEKESFKRYRVIYRKRYEKNCVESRFLNYHEESYIKHSPENYFIKDETLANLITTYIIKEEIDDKKVPEELKIEGIRYLNFIGGRGGCYGQQTEEAEVRLRDWTVFPFLCFEENWVAINKNTLKDHCQKSSFSLNVVEIYSALSNDPLKIQDLKIEEGSFSYREKGDNTPWLRLDKEETIFDNILNKSVVLKAKTVEGLLTEIKKQDSEEKQRKELNKQYSQLISKAEDEWKDLKTSNDLRKWKQEKKKDLETLLKEFNQNFPKKERIGWQILFHVQLRKKIEKFEKWEKETVLKLRSGFAKEDNKKNKKTKLSNKEQQKTKNLIKKKISALFRYAGRGPTVFQPNIHCSLFLSSDAKPGESGKYTIEIRDDHPALTNASQQFWKILTDQNKYQTVKLTWYKSEENKKLFEKDDFIEIEKDELAPLIKQAQKENDSVKLAKLINDIKTYHNKPIYLDYSQKINDLVNKQIDLSNQETSVLLTNLKKLNIKLIEKELKALDKSKDLSNLITKLAPENQNFVNEINLAGEQDQIETIKNRVSTDIAKVKATIAKEKKNLLKNNNDSLTKNLLYGSLFAIIVLLVCYLVVKIVKKPSWRK
ncbi:hypothetical protein [endosymbiont GvMRE of Glomus versiforme]|uniref:hypothetical protein n=1 Tax=endosymbiont GvMRE of Glomus versiforme TaxID=2039283 RepID=UPI000EC164F3|nr:hypothetical protein [endosymbiont GvMRE of Glomus versiforme]RHZ35360.1 hypothetical protein GvMRE_IIg439 [endosymbiont GvMRE of Glomus versiforme]